MALRIAVNRELEELDALLESIPRLVKPGGRAVIITFMSLEDRRVKHAFQAMARAGSAEILTRHVVRPSEEETAENAASAAPNFARCSSVNCALKGQDEIMATLATMYSRLFARDVESRQISRAADVAFTPASLRQRGYLPVR
jgi:hypothetical protein